MNVITNLIDFILHIDKHLAAMAQTYGMWVYIVLFVIIFIETGVVIFPFLPGDSLLFAAGALAALPGRGLNVFLLFLVMGLAAAVGDTVNYFIGDKLGQHIIDKGRFGRLINAEKMQKAQHFFDTYGGKTIFIGRFIPFIRTFVPFVAGASKMSYLHFIAYNILGAVCWTTVGLAAGYFFGNIAFIQAHFSFVLLAIVAVSVVPMIIGHLRSRKKKAVVEE